MRLKHRRLAHFRIRAKCGLSTLVSFASAALAFFWAGCGEGGSRTAKSNGIRELNELPIGQMRVMLKGFPGDWRPDSDRSKGLPVPPAEKPVPPDVRRIPLMPGAELRLGTMSVREAITGRRSRRNFSPTPLTLEELGYLLWATQGVTGVQTDDDGNVVERFRAAPSAGARYPLETYLAVKHVEGLAPGLYRFRPAENELILLREEESLSEALGTACYDQPFVREAAVVFVWTAVPYRTEWKYAYISHRMIAMEAGHVCENLYLAAESIGAGVCAVESYHQPRLDELIGADGRDEFALYLACVGKPLATEK